MSISMNSQLQSVVDQITFSTASEPEKCMNALPIALCVIAAFADDTTSYSNGCLNRYSQKCKVLVERPIFKAYCRKCGIDVGLRPKSTIELTQDQTDVLIENAASIVVRSDEAKKILALRFAFRVIEKLTLMDVHEFVSNTVDSERSLVG